MARAAIVSRLFLYTAIAAVILGAAMAHRVSAAPTPSYAQAIAAR